MSFDKDYITSKEVLRNKIIDFAIGAFAAKGIRSVTMDEIASSVGISKRTLYETFEDKETLLCDCLKVNQKKKERGISKMLDKGMNVMEIILATYQENIEFLMKADKSFFTDIKRYPKAQELIATNRRQNANAATAFFMTGVKQGLFRDDINFDILTTLAHQQLEAISATDILNRYSLKEVYETLLFTHIRGIATEKGAEMLNRFKREIQKSN